MRRILLAGAAFVLSAGVAMADGTASIPISAEQAQFCEITAVSPNLALAGVNDAIQGTFKYKCNYDGAPILTFKSLNGKVVTAENGGGFANYGIYLNDNAPSSDPDTWLQSSAAMGAGVTYPLPVITTGSANVEQEPDFWVGLSQPLPVAGLYSDTLTIDIAP